MITCKRLRTAVLLSALLLVLGLIMETVAIATPWIVTMTYLALFFVLAGAAVLTITFIANLLPGTAKRLSECQH